MARVCSSTDSSWPRVRGVVCQRVMRARISYRPHGAVLTNRLLPWLRVPTVLAVNRGSGIFDQAGASKTITLSSGLHTIKVRRWRQGA